MLNRIARYLGSSVLAVAMFAGGASGDCTGSGTITSYTGSICSSLVPGPNQVIVYMGADYNNALILRPYVFGSCAVLGLGRYPHSYSFAMDNDTVSSIKVGSGVRAVLYSDACFEGRQENFYYNDSNLSGNYIGDNSASSIEVLSTAIATRSSP